MNKEEVIARIGKDKWKLFQQFMFGQTVGMKGNEVDYYKQDVIHFCNIHNIQWN